MLKDKARQQFGRLPYISNDGEGYYLDLLVWRVNRNLKKLPVFVEFCKSLLFWTIDPIEDWSRKIPLFLEMNKT